MPYPLPPVSCRICFHTSPVSTSHRLPLTARLPRHTPRPAWYGCAVDPSVQNGSLVQHVVHVTVRDRPAIKRLVSAINSVGSYHTVLPICHGGRPSPTGPAWLSCIRPDGP